MSGSRKISELPEVETQPEPLYDYNDLGKVVNGFRTGIMQDRQQHLTFELMYSMALKIKELESKIDSK